MTSFLDVCRFNPSSGGTGNFVVAGAVGGYQNPASAQAVDGAIYKYRAESADLTQWEVGYGAYTVSSTTLARTTILFNSLGTQAAINFSSVPQVAIVGLAEDLVPVDGSIYGLILSTAGSSTTFAVAAGSAGDSTGVNVLRLAASISKTTGAWAVGSGNGSFDGTGTGPTAAAAFFHVFLIKRLDTGVVDVLTSSSATAPTLPANYTLFRRIGFLKTDGSFNWLGFTQVGDEFHWSVNFTELNGVQISATTANTLTLAGAPPGVQVNSLLHIGLQAAAATAVGVLITSLDESDVAVFSLGSNATIYAPISFFTAADINKRTNTSAQIRWRANGNSTGMLISVYTYGVIDYRGRFGVP